MSALRIEPSLTFLDAVAKVDAAHLQQSGLPVLLLVEALTSAAQHHVTKALTAQPHKRPEHTPTHLQRALSCLTCAQQVLIEGNPAALSDADSRFVARVAHALSYVCSASGNPSQRRVYLTLALPHLAPEGQISARRSLTATQHSGALRDGPILKLMALWVRVGVNDVVLAINQRSTVRLLMACAEYKIIQAVKSPPKSEERIGEAREFLDAAWNTVLTAPINVPGDVLDIQRYADDIDNMAAIDGRYELAHTADNEAVQRLVELMKHSSADVAEVGLLCGTRLLVRSAIRPFHGDQSLYLKKAASCLADALQRQFPHMQGRAKAALAIA